MKTVILIIVGIAILAAFIAVIVAVFTNHDGGGYEFDEEEWRMQFDCITKRNNWEALGLNDSHDDSED